MVENHHRHVNIIRIRNATPQRRGQRTSQTYRWPIGRTIDRLSITIGQKTYWPIAYRNNQDFFGRHAADAMRWSGGCGGCWSPPGHRPGWCHLPKWSSTRKFRVPTLRKAVLLERAVFSRNDPAKLPSRRMWRDRLLRSRSGAWQSGSSRSTTPSRMDAEWEALGKHLA